VWILVLAVAEFYSTTRSSAKASRKTKNGSREISSLGMAFVLFSFGQAPNLDEVEELPLSFMARPLESFSSPIRFEVFQQTQLLLLATTSHFAGSDE